MQRRGETRRSQKMTQRWGNDIEEEGNEGRKKRETRRRSRGK